MKEFDYKLEEIFSGVSPFKVNPKNAVRLLECHNLEPTGQDCELHEFIVDLDTDSYAWGNP